MPAKSLDEIIAELPEAWRPWAAEYGPALLAMGTEELAAWIRLLVAGDVTAAYGQILAKMDNPTLLDEWQSLNGAWGEANEAQARRLELQREAMLALLKVCLAVALAAAGL